MKPPFSLPFTLFAVTAELHSAILVLSAPLQFHSPNPQCQRLPAPEPSKQRDADRSQDKQYNDGHIT